MIYTNGIININDGIYYIGLTAISTRYIVNWYRLANCKSQWW